MSEKRTGVVFPWETQAMNGEEMPQGLSFPDKAFYVFLRGLYAQYRSGVIDRDVAVREKRVAIRDYEAMKFGCENCDRWTNTINATELARAAYRKERTLENADRLLKAIDGVGGNKT